MNACNESESVPGDEDYVQEELTAFNPTVKRVVFYTKTMIKLSQLQKGLPAKNINTESGDIDDHDCQWKVRGVDSCKFVEKFVEKDAKFSRSNV